MHYFYDESPAGLDAADDAAFLAREFGRPARRPCPECGQFAAHHPNCPNCELDPTEETETELD